MVGTDMSWESLEKWSAWIFLVTGASMLIPSARSAIEMVTAISFSGIITGLIAFIGIILSYIGLIGLFPRLTDKTPRLARAGIVLFGLPVILILVAEVLFLEGMLPAPVIVFSSIFLLFVLGTASFGVASLRSRVPSLLCI